LIVSFRKRIVIGGPYIARRKLSPCPSTLWAALLTSTSCCNYYVTNTSVFIMFHKLVSQVVYRIRVHVISNK
jgi:hypothetical protein